jgi:hypothetical protein
MNGFELAYGTGQHRRAPRPSTRHEDLSGDIMEMGKMAVTGMVTVGVVGALGSAFKKD